ncbi:glycosyl hydrolase [Chitinophagaceae bacterium LB-8]|uniref:Glycosyl hydrolase n=1 Tax=Paraflavisolibacter caeni TaxID=2982496 RepID=A0A9X3BI72_9BACT|nr:glycosyl hydrolase [Paraflavisolibacter caeni]MCU7549728.1 glycosyl hydrolase [Paraflavisolibacter caeni]
MYTFHRFLLFIISLSIATSSVNAQQTKTDTLLKGFMNPSNVAKPRVWWHWMNGNISKDGIRKDLEWMYRSGIGGFQNFDAALMTPQIVEKRLTYMTPEWKEVFRYTTKLADSLKLEMAIAGSPGWSESGGPWVTPEDGMKKLVWTETRIKGGSSNIKLAKPAGTTGPFQNLLKQPEFGMSQAEPKTPPTFYKDIAVLAYKLPGTDKSLSELNVVVTSSGGQFNLSQLTDGDIGVSNLLPSDTAKGFAWIQFAFPQPQTIKAITMMGGGDKGPFGLLGEFKDNRSLEVSDDGVNFKRVCYIPAGNVLQQTIAIPPTTAKYFRVTVKNPPPTPNLGAMMGVGGEAPKAPAGTQITELVLYTSSRINWAEEKAAFAPAMDLDAKATPAAQDVIVMEDIMDITDKLNADGTLNWTAPAGNWKVVRFGYSLIGKENHPASPEATGLEVDKLDPVAIKKYFTNYLEQYKEATGGLMGSKGGLQYVITDSWEAGAQNWTANLPQEFQKRRGYSMLPWMPVLTGQVLKSTQASEQFLFDFRKTLSDMVAEYHYDGLTNILNQYGMKRYSESHENGRALIADGMEVKRTAAVPMSAMWTPDGIGGGENMHQADIRESASVAHIYGQNLVAAESLTAFGLMGNAWSYDPQKLKPTADLELASGLNRFVIHTSVHQPSDEKVPGLGLGPFGQWFNRHETWAGQAKAWTSYLARSSYMLQQGKFVADVVYYYGEDNNITALFGKKLPAVSEGYNFDFINADALIHLLSVKDGKLVTPSGMSYRLLVLDSNARKMSLPVLRKIAQLVKDGATISGVKPESTPSLQDDPQEFQRLVNEVWGKAQHSSKASVIGKVYTGMSIQEVLTDLNIQPDFTYTKSQNDTKLLYVHRKLKDGDIYWVNNRNDRSELVEATFRVSVKVPQIWHPETGRTDAVSYSIANGRTTVSLNLTPNDAVFVVFQATATKTVVTLPKVIEKEVATIDGSWKLAFQPNRGAPARATFDKLTSWTESSDTGIRYFSGTAAYTKNINVQANVISKGAQLWLDLGDVKNLAEVTVNGKTMGVVWKKPFHVDITNAVKAGENTIEIKVTNLWVNRLIGDAQPGVTNKITYTTMPFYKAEDKLLPSGLLGPVKIISFSQQ